MSKSILFPGLKNSMKVRVIINGVGVRTTVKHLLHGVFENLSHNDAVWSAAKYLGELRVEAEDVSLMPLSVVTERYGHQVQIDLL